MRSTLTLGLRFEMRVLQFSRAGLPLIETDIDVPVAATGDVLIQVQAAGICRSDAHYRSGFPFVEEGIVFGHEVAGEIVSLGAQTSARNVGDRVVVHYTVGCGTCRFCDAGQERFCSSGEMIGKDRNGGYAEYLPVPARNTVLVPESVSYNAAAVMGCSSSTSLHALRKGRLSAGEVVAVIGAGGLGVSAIQLALVLGASKVFAVDIDEDKLAAATTFGAIPINGADDPVAAINAAGGADVALELVGSSALMRTCLDVLRPLGRAVAVGLTPDTFDVGPYTDLVSGEKELIGCSDHTIANLEELMRLADSGLFAADTLVTNTVRFTSKSVNSVLDALDSGTAPARTIIQFD